MSRSPESLRAALIAAFRAGLAELDPALLVERALAGEAPDAALAPAAPAGARGGAATTPAPRRGRVAVIAAGKAAPGMARGALRAWGDRIDGGLVVTVGSHAAASAPDEEAIGPLTLVRAAHPIPDARSVAAANDALALAAQLGPGDLLLALISGGASALLSAPPPGVPLADKQALVAALLEGGAPIQEVNLVRRHFSRVKGGRLAVAAAPARVLTLLVSDVVSGLPHDVSSGPTVPDPTELAAALAALRRWAPQLVARLAPALTESPKPGDAAHQEARLLADPDALAARVAAVLSAATGLHAVAAPAEDGDARAIVARRLALAHTLAPGEAVVIPCEPTVTLPARRGAGGRAGWVALAAMRGLPPDTALLCGASDGADGSSGAAGAAVILADAAAIDPRAIDAALDGFDDAAIHRALGTRLDGGPTGHNLTDVHILARAFGREGRGDGDDDPARPAR